MESLTMGSIKRIVIITIITTLLGINAFFSVMIYLQTKQTNDVQTCIYSFGANNNDGNPELNLYKCLHQ